MFDMVSSFEDNRNARRKSQTHTTCRFDDDRVDYRVYEMSAHGFSFLCPKEACIFKRGVVLVQIAIANGEGNEVIRGSGSVIHVTEFDYGHLRVGVRYTKKTLDRTVAGKIRVPRRFPRVKLDVLLSLSHNGDKAPVPGVIIDFTASTARIGFNGNGTAQMAVGRFTIGRVPLLP